MKTMNGYRVLVLCILAGSILLSCSKDDDTDPEPRSLEEKLQLAMDRSISKNDGKGLSLAVILPDGETLTLASGISKPGVPVTTDMHFSAGSITKMFTACTILKYQELGLLSLDDSAGKWLPPYPNINGSVSIRQLLNHTSGTFNFTENSAFWQALYSDPEKIWRTEEPLESYILPPTFEPGTDWGYSNTGYLMLRRIIELVSQRTVAAEYREHLLEPLSLKHTFCYLDEEVPDEVATGWIDLSGNNIYDQLPHHFLKSFYSAAGGGIFATAEDLALWIRKLLYEKKVISQASLDEMLDLHTPTTAEDLVDGYGLGIYRFNDQLTGGLEVIGHGGDPPGYAAGAMYISKYQVCIGIADNTELGNSMYVIEDVIHIIQEHMTANAEH